MVQEVILQEIIMMELNPVKMMENPNGQYIGRFYFSIILTMKMVLMISSS